MSSVIKTFRKTAVERRRLYLDYSCWLEDVETITSVTVTTTPFTEAAPITVSTGYVDAAHKKMVVFVGGGVANTAYTISFVAQTDAGQIKQDDIGLRVY